MPSIKRKSGDLRTEVLEGASSALHAAGQSKRPRLSIAPSEDTRSRESTIFNEADFASTQFEASGSILNEYQAARDDSPDADSEEDAERLDEAAREFAARKKARGSRLNQAAADCGILQSVTCQNFMCHVKLHVDFGPLINFIIGHNGSGKSAVLTAITLCLGGKATSTNRGQSLRSFVREGSDASTLTVKIKNQGIGAFKRDQYGDAIIVERHFTIHGQSGFKIKSKDGRIVSTKRLELDEITDFFALQLDNPVNVLTQDQARQFLNSSSDADKYRFFMKGVQLEQLDLDYSILGEQLDSAEHALDNVKEDAKALKRKYDAAKEKKRIAEKSDTIRDRIRKYSRQMAWSQVEEQEQELQRCEQVVEDQRLRVRRVEEAFRNNEAQFEQANQVVQDSSSDVNHLKQARDPLVQSHREAKEKFEDVRREISESQNTARDIKGNLDSERKQLDQIEKAIEDEYRRLNEQSDGRETEKRNEIREAEERLDDIHQQGLHHDAAYRQLEQDHQEGERRFKDSMGQEKRKQGVVRDAQAQLTELQKDNHDKFAPFHPSMRNVVKAIDQERNFRTKPIGPLAWHVRNQQPEWQNMIEKTFGSLLDNFIVTSRQDQTLLSNILRKNKCPSHVLVADPNFRMPPLKEPDERYNTILRTLDIDNDIVRNQLIITTAIEQTILVKTQNEAIALTENRLPEYCKAVMCPHPHERGRGFRYMQGRGGSQKMEPVDAWRGRQRMKTDDQAAIRAQQETVQALKDDLFEAEQRTRECGEAVKSAKQALVAYMRRKKDLQLQSQRAEDRLAELRGELEEMQPQDGALDGLKQQQEEHKDQVEHLRQQLEATNQEREDIALRNRDNKNTLDHLTKEIEASDAAIAAAEKKCKKYDESRMRSLLQKNEAEQTIRDRQADVAKAETDRDTQARQVESWAAQASEISPRIPVDEGLDSNALEKKLDRLHRELSSHTRNAGGDKESIELAYLAAKQALMDNEKNFHATVGLLRRLTRTLYDRTSVWKHFREHITVRARGEFAHLMSERGFRGEMKVNHRSKTLSLDVNPDTKRSAGAGGRQTKTLSGGEKSFSTVCMLLSLWEAMGSPIRCLDEFDVFMDSVNRDYSMKMMIECARQAVGRQFILITPQAMGAVEGLEDVRVNRLNDPERGQTALNL